MKLKQVGALWVKGDSIRGRMDIDGKDVSVWITPNTRKTLEEDPDFFIRLGRDELRRDRQVASRRNTQIGK